MPDTAMICFSVYAATHDFNRVYKDLLAPLGLTYPQYLVMLELWKQDAQTVGQLGAAIDLESNTLTPLLKRMEQAGFLTRQRSATDERQVVVSLTEQGAALRAKAAEVPACVGEAIGMDMTKLETLIGLLAEMRHNLSTRSTPAH